MGFLKRMLGGASPQRPHDDPELESQLPAAVAGRQLERWSKRGAAAFAPDGRALSPGDAASLDRDLGAMGIALDDVSMAVAGRAAPSDPPHLIQAWRFGKRPAAEMPLDMTLDVKGLGGWQLGVLGGKAVARGTIDMLRQTSHARGRPYVVRSDHVQFSIATDDEGWAEEVCRLLPAPAGVLAGGSDQAGAGPRSAIDQALQRLAQGDGTFAVFEVPGGRNIYAQVHVGKTVADPLVGEVVGNQYLDPADRLDEAAHGRLAAMGWTANHSGIGNFGRDWPDWASSAGRTSVAGDLLDALELFGSRSPALWIEVGAK